MPMRDQFGLRGLAVIQVLQIPPDHPRQRPRLRLAQQLREAGGTIPCRTQCLHQCSRQRGPGHRATPEILHHFQPQLVVAGEQFGAERCACHEGRIGDGPLTEPVDGENGCLIEGLQGQPHLLKDPRRRPTGAFEHPGQQFVQFARACARRHPGFEQHLQLGQPAADALAQLGRSGIGESDHQQLLHTERPLQQQAQIEQADGVGLASSGRRFDQLQSLQG